jgi:hypothetical protein
LRYLPSEVDDYVIQTLAEVALLQRGCTNDRAVGPGSCALAEIADSCSNFCNGPAMRF